MMLMQRLLNEGVAPMALAIPPSNPAIMMIPEMMPPPPQQNIPRQPMGTPDQFKKQNVPTFLSSAALAPPAQTGMKSLLGT